MYWTKNSTEVIKVQNIDDFRVGGEKEQSQYCVISGRQSEMFQKDY